MLSDTKVESFKDLIVWQKSMKLVSHIYELTGAFPDEEKFGITNQMRRAAVSVPSNIAEGWGRKSTGSYVQFLNIAKGSLYELETQTLISKDLGFATSISDISDLITEVSKMLNAIIKKLKK